LLNNIFLFKGKNFTDLDQLNIFSYPTEIISIENKDQISKIIYGHDHGDIIHKYRTHKTNGKKPNNLNFYEIDNPVPQKIDDLNVYTTCINGKVVIGLIFDKDDNPYDYKSIFEETLNELLNNEKVCSFEDEIEIENLLITIFVDIRKFGDENIENFIEDKFPFQEPFIKIFLFGIDDVGKSSLVRKIKTGKFEDNFFVPNKKFNIDYIQSKKLGLLTFWDMPGQSSFRNKWLGGLQDTNLIIFMIDIANQIRFEEAKTEFWKILNNKEFFGLPLLILCNKIDLLDHSKEFNNSDIEKLQNEVVTYFEFDKLEDRKWKIVFTSIKANFNLNSIIDSIYDLI
jgi:small GTP-binding protein